MKIWTRNQNTPIQKKPKPTPYILLTTLWIEQNYKKNSDKEKKICLTSTHISFQLYPVRFPEKLQMSNGQNVLFQFLNA